MYTTVDFRRKLLRFDRPLYPRFIRSTIPKFYSSFFGSWRPYYENVECDSKPEWYPLKFPIRDEVVSPTICYDKNTINPLSNLKYSSLFTYFIVFVLLLWFAGNKLKR